MLLTATLGALALLSLLLTLWQWAVAWRFPLHERCEHSDFAPAVTLLKPLKGCDAETAACLESWLTQHYSSPMEMLCGVVDPDDPVWAVVQRQQAAHPEREVRLVLCQAVHGPNGKVSTLTQLEPLVRYEYVVISDADVRVPRDFLRQLLAPMRDPQVGLVSSLYRLANPASFPMRWEAFAVNGDFWTQVLQSRSFKALDFALGAAMATTRTQLARIGGFALLREFLADDYQLGHRIAQTGGRIELAKVVAECWTAPVTWREVWNHQVRWARTIRVCQPLPYLLSILSNATLWPLLWLLGSPAGPVALFAGLSLLVRMGTGWYFVKKMTRQSDLNALWLAPVKDFVQVLIWALAFSGAEVIWRGQRFRVRPGGKLEVVSRRLASGMSSKAGF